MMLGRDDKTETLDGSLRLPSESGKDTAGLGRYHLTRLDLARFRTGLKQIEHRLQARFCGKWSGFPRNPAPPVDGPALSNSKMIGPHMAAPRLRRRALRIGLKPVTENGPAPRADAARRPNCNSYGVYLVGCHSWIGSPLGK